MRTKTVELTLELNSGVDELYDLAADPEEMNNLFEDSAASALRAELTTLVESRHGPAISQSREPIGMA